jgi:hypothetical protein
MKRIILAIVLAVSVVTVPTGCLKNQVKAPIPGATSNFDSSAYQTLRTAHDIAKSLSDQAAAGNFKPSPTQKVAINQFIADLNVADTVYAAYHNGAATQAQAQSAIDKVTAEQANNRCRSTSRLEDIFDNFRGK